MFLMCLKACFFWLEESDIFISKWDQTVDSFSTMNTEYSLWKKMCVVVTGLVLEGLVCIFFQVCNLCSWSQCLPHPRWLTGIAVVLSALVLAEGSLRSSTVLHSEILDSGLRAPMQFFDSTPAGRIINRFSKDIDVIDSQLPRSLHAWFACALSVCATLFVICYSTPMFLAIIVPMAIIYYFVQVLVLLTSYSFNCG